MRRLCLQVSILIALVPQTTLAATSESLSERARNTRPLDLFESLLEDASLELAHAAIIEATNTSMATGDSTAVCTLLVTRGIAELRQQEHVAALATLTTAIEWSQAARDSLSWLDAMGFRAQGQVTLGRYNEALGTCRSIIELAIAARQPSSEAWGRVGIAFNALVTNQLEKALDEYSRATELFRSDGNARDELTALVGLGRTYSGLARIADAKSCYQKVFLVATDIGAHVNAGHALNNLGVLEHEYGDISLAIGYYERAREQFLLAGSVGGAINAAANIADGWLNLGRNRDAIDVLNTVLALAERSDRRQDVGTLKSKLAWAYLEDGRSHHAERLFRAASAMGDTLASKTRAETALGLAESLHATGNSDAGIELLQRYLDHETESWQRVTLHYLLARLFRRTGQPVPALQHAREALRLAEGFQESRVLDAILLELSSCCRDAGELQLADTRFDQALAAVEKGRIRVSDSDWREARGWEIGPYVVEAAEIRRIFPEELTQAERDLNFYDVLKNFKSRTLLERIQAGGQMASRHRSPQEIQSEVLSADDLLIEFFVSAQNSWLFALTRDEVRVLRIPGASSGFATRVSDYVSLLAAPSSDARGESAGLEQARQSLSETLLGEVDDLIEKARRIIVIPDGYLHSLPFGILSFSEDGSPIMASHEIYRVPSTSFLRPSTTKASTTRASTLVAMAGVDRDGGPLAGARREVDGLRRNFLHARVVEGELRKEFLRDEFADASVLHFAAHIDVNDESPWHSGILLAVGESRAPNTNVEAGTTRGLSILSSEDSLRVRESLRGEHYLRAADIAGWKLSADLAVLSGCESALGLVTVGEGVIGFGGAFLSAGVRTVVASLWPVADLHVEPLMQDFYAGLAEGKSVSGALSDAQLAMRSRTGMQHPFYWAGFVVIGDGNALVPLETRPRSFNLLFILAGMSMVTGLVAIVLRRRRRRAR